MITLYTLLLSILLILNGFCIVNKERVLNKYLRQQQHSFHQEDAGIVMRLVQLTVSIQTVLRIPLIAVNAVVIVLKVIFG